MRRHEGQEGQHVKTQRRSNLFIAMKIYFINKYETEKIDDFVLDIELDTMILPCWIFSTVISGRYLTDYYYNHLNIVIIMPYNNCLQLYIE